jgi:alcohol dehydrogenase
VVGNGAAESVGVEAKRLGARNALIVTDATLKRVGLADQVAAWLAAEGVASTTYSDVEWEPSADGVDRAAEFARASGCDLVVAVGGGSSMDTGKALAVLMGNPGQLRGYLGTGLVQKRGIPSIQTILVPSGPVVFA